MSNEIIKLDDDFYVVWYDEGPGAWGTREEVEATIIRWETERAVERIKWETTRRFERTDVHGRSSMIERDPVGPSTFRYYDRNLEETGFVYGDRLKAFLDSWNAESQTFSLEHVQPYEPESDYRPTDYVQPRGGS